MSSATARKSAGASTPAHRVLPAQQGLDGDGLQVGCGAHRLVVQPQLAAGQRLAQLDLEVEPELGLGVQRLVEEVDAAAAVALGPVHRRVGVAQDVLGAAAGGRHGGDADARRDGDGAAVVAHRLADGREHPAGDDTGLGRVVEVGADDDELVTAEAGDEVARACGRLQPGGRLDEQDVAPGVPEAVVHRT